MLTDESIVSLEKKLLTKEISAAELVGECQANIKKYQPSVNALITQVQPQTTNGIPFVLKDSYTTKGIKTTAASKVLESYIPQYNATVVNRLHEHTLLGKANMDAWGHGGSTENTDFGLTRNPYDLSRVPGGSGGGPAVAVATGMCMFAIGEDTGGSIRNPAGWCNITGLKVTYGRVSRYGCIAYASSLDTVGPTAKTAEDCAWVLQQIAGQDPLDATSSPTPVPDYLAELNRGVNGLKIGLPKEFFGPGLDPEIKTLIETAAKKYEELGAKLVEVSLPTLQYAIPVYYLIAPSETSSNLARYDGIRYGQSRSHFTAESMRRIMIGTYALSAGYYDAYYKKALQARTLIIQDYAKAFTSCDLILAPVSPTPPPKFGELIGDPVKNLLADIYTVTTNTAGIPSLALPCGFTSTRLPVGMQLQGPMFSEKLLLSTGHAYQQVTSHHHEHPTIS